MRGLTIAAVLSCLALAGPARAQGAPSDSSVRDTTLRGATVVPGPATLAVPSPAGGEKQRPWHEQPWSIMMRSALVPGWGQFKNHRPLKAGAAIVIEGVAGVRLVQAWQDVDDALAKEQAAIDAGDEAALEAARAEYDDAFNRRAAAGWVLGLAVLVSMVDAYVDAHLLQFDADFGPDPALPADVTGLRSGGPETRLSLRWSFTGP